MTDVTTVYALKAVGRDLELYAREHDGRLPATLDDLHTGSALLRDPFSGSEFYYVGSGRTWGFSPTNGGAVVACTRNHQQDRHQYALLDDGAVLRFSDAGLDRELHPRP